MDYQLVRDTAAVTTTRCYQNGLPIYEGFSLEMLDEHLANEQAIVWVDLCEPTLEELQTVADELGLHALAVEDAANERQRPKFDRYEHHDFLSAYAVRLDNDSGELVTSEVAAFITPKALVTVRKDEHFPGNDLLDHVDENAELSAHGVSALLYALLDFVVDGHFDTVQDLDDQIEGLEDLLFDDRPRDSEVQRRSSNCERASCDCDASFSRCGRS